MPIRDDAIGHRDIQLIKNAVEILDGSLHEPADLELDDPFGRNLHALECARVLRQSRRAVLRFKNTEIPELQPIASAQLKDHVVEKTLNDFFDDDPPAASVPRHLLNEVFFRNRAHR